MTDIQVEGRYYSVASASVSNGGDFDIDPGESELNALEIHSFVHGGSCDVKYLKDTTGDGSFDVNITIDSLTGNGISQHNKVEVGENSREKIRITNTSGSAADFAVTGRQVSQ